MTNLSDLYDPDVIAAITSSFDGKEGEVKEEEVTDPFLLPQAKEIKDKKNHVKFSTLFWKPKTIPDLIFRQFKEEDWEAEARNHIPDVDDKWVWNRPVLEAFALAMYCGDTTLLFGLAGTGKSCLAEQWCAVLKIPYWRMNCNRETREAHFLGSPAVVYNEEGQMSIKQEPTILTDSLKYGGLFCEDEAFRHNSALVLQSLREKARRTVLLPDAPGRTADERKLVAPKGRWWYVLTDNTAGTGDDTGLFQAEIQDASTLDRIDSGIEVPYLGKPLERQVLQKYTDFTPEVINGMLDFAKEVRKAFANQQLTNTFSIRSLLAWSEKAALMGNLEDGLKVAWYNMLCKQDQDTVRDMYHQIFAHKL